MIANLCVSIPQELESFCIKHAGTEKVLSKPLEKYDGFGVKLVKKDGGELDFAAYYSDSGDLIKKVFYKGSSITGIHLFRNGMLYSDEKYKDDKITSKVIYDKYNKISSEVLYNYNRKGYVTSINKFKCNTDYLAEYGYDELCRVNSRKISINKNVVNEQKYRYDILDRIVEYVDFNQRVKVHQVNSYNQLIYYTITDKMGNDISIINFFDDSRYLKTELTLNGHKISLVDISYVDNIMLKKPYTNEDDLDLIISNMFSEQSDSTTKRTFAMDLSNGIIDENIKSRTLPISIRKRLLYNLSLNAS